MVDEVVTILHDAFFICFEVVDINDEGAPSLLSPLILKTAPDGLRLLHVGECDGLGGLAIFPNVITPPFVAVELECDRRTTLHHNDAVGGGCSFVGDGDIDLAMMAVAKDGYGETKFALCTVFVSVGNAIDKGAVGCDGDAA